MVRVSGLQLKRSEFEASQVFFVFVSFFLHHIELYCLRFSSYEPKAHNIVVEPSSVCSCVSFHFQIQISSQVVNQLQSDFV